MRAKQNPSDFEGARIEEEASQWLGQATLWRSNVAFAGLYVNLVWQRWRAIVEADRTSWGSGGELGSPGLENKRKKLGREEEETMIAIWESRDRV